MELAAALSTCNEGDGNRGSRLINSDESYLHRRILRGSAASAGEEEADSLVSTSQGRDGPKPSPGRSRTVLHLPEYYGRGKCDGLIDSVTLGREVSLLDFPRLRDSSRSSTRPGAINAIGGTDR